MTYSQKKPTITTTFIFVLGCYICTQMFRTKFIPEVSHIVYYFPLISFKIVFNNVQYLILLENKLKGNYLWEFK